MKPSGPAKSCLAALPGRLGRPFFLTVNAAEATKTTGGGFFLAGK